MPDTFSKSLPNKILPWGSVPEELEFVIVTKFDFSRFPTTYSTQ